MWSGPAKILPANQPSLGGGDWRLGGGVTLQEGEGDHLEGFLVGGQQVYGRGAAGLFGFQPARGTEAPAVPWLQTREIICLLWGDQVISTALTPE